MMELLIRGGEQESSMLLVTWMKRKNIKVVNGRECEWNDTNIAIFHCYVQISNDVIMAISMGIL